MAQNTKENTFIVQVAYQQNHTWQGTIKWVNQAKETCFRSTLELIHIIDDAITPDNIDVDGKSD